MAYVGETHESGASACYSNQDFGDDPLLPQKALPLPDDSEDYCVLQNGPADVVAAAASAMAACDSLPDAAAESLMQPLAEAYLLAVRREAQSLPKVVSAVSGGRRTRQPFESGISASVLNTAGACTNTISGLTHVVHSSDSSHAESKGKIVTSESFLTTSTQSVAVSLAAEPPRPTVSASQKTVYRDFIDISSNGEEAGSIGCSVLSPFSASSDEEMGWEAVSVAPFVRDVRDSERSSSKGFEATIERENAGGTFSKERPGCRVTDATESAQQRSVSRSRRKSNEDTKTAAVLADGQGHGHMTAALGGLGQPSCAAETTCQQVQEGFVGVVKNLGVAEIPPLDGCADADSVCNASHVGASGGSLSLGSAGEEVLGASTDAEAAAVDSHTAGPCVWRTMAEAGQFSEGSRPKVVAAYVDRLILLDRQREAASASAVAPAAEWRAAALHQFKRLRNYVNSDEFSLSGHQQPEVGTDCLSWSEQEWQLYCRCYPPSPRLLGACDTVTVCKLLFMLVEDLKQQQLVVAKAERKRSSDVNCDGSSSRGPGPVAEGLSPTRQDAAETETKDERTGALSDAPRPQQQRRTGEVKQEDERGRTFAAQIHQRLCEDEREGDQRPGARHENEDKQQDFTAGDSLQFSAKENHVSSARANDKEDGANIADGRTPVAKDADDVESGLHDGEGKSAEKRTVNVLSNEGTCKCCRHRDCCVTLQQACWLFGVFVFLDELQAMDADVASCIQQLRRICESAREQASCRRTTAQPHFPSAPRAAEASERTSEGKNWDTLLTENEKEVVTWVANDLVAALNLLIVVINDFFNQR